MPVIPRDAVTRRGRRSAPSLPTTSARFLVVILFTGLAIAAAQDKPRSFSVPITIKGLPPDTAIPVFGRADFSAWLEELHVAGAVDERSLRLYQVGHGEPTEIPVQFTCEAQPRSNRRHLLPGTNPKVSYVSESAAGETPEAVRTVGELAWMVRGLTNGTAEFLLHFNVPTTGRLVQVPFPPHNLRAFDEAGRSSPVRWFPSMRITPQWPRDGAVHLFEQQQLVTSYHTGPTVQNLSEGASVRRPFFYPVNGPEGIALTEFGKPHDPTGSHAHHYSLWIAHANVDGQDFWGEKGGMIAHEQFEEMEDGPLFCRLVQKTRWIGQGTPLLRERRTITVFKEFGDFRLWDLDLEFTPASSAPVTLGKTSFGFLAARVAPSMTPFDGGGEIRNSQGHVNESQVHFQRARWLDQSGPVTPDRWGGIALFDHPQNLNHPTGWHCRNDGWAGASFNLQEPFTLAAGKTLRLRYRVHLHKGNAVQGEVEKRFQEYARQPEIAFGQPRAER